MTKDLGDAGDTGTTIQPLQAPSLSRRMACWLYEGMLLFGVVFIAGYLFSTLSQTRNALDNRNALQAFIFLVLGIYFSWFWSKGQNIGDENLANPRCQSTGPSLISNSSVDTLFFELGLVLTAYRHGQHI